MNGVQLNAPPRTNADHAATRPTPTQPRAMNNPNYNPKAFCRKCERLCLPAVGHWANNCPNTVCPVCNEENPGHYSTTCPEYKCPICKVVQAGHKRAECPGYPEYIRQAEERRKARTYDNPRDAFDDEYYDDGVSMDYSTLSA